MKNRLQIRFCETLFKKRDEAIEYINTTFAKTTDGLAALLAEPLVCFYGSAENRVDAKAIIAIGKGGDGIDKLSNIDDVPYFIIDTAHLEEDIKTLQEESGKYKEWLQKIYETIGQMLEDAKSLHTELDNTQVGAGLEEDGSYAPVIDANYISESNSLKDAIKALDTYLKSEETARINEDEKIQAELNNTQEGAGLKEDGSYDTSKLKDTTYLKETESLFDSEIELDKNLKSISDGLEANNVLTENIRISAGFDEKGNYIPYQKGESNFLETSKTLQGADGILDEILGNVVSGAGFDKETGKYIPCKSKEHYFVNDASSLYDADLKLDSAIGKPADGISEETIYGRLNAEIERAKGEESTIKAYTVNGKQISSNPVLDGRDVKLDGYVKAEGEVIASDTVNKAIGKLDKSLDNEKLRAEAAEKKATTEVKVKEVDKPYFDFGSKSSEIDGHNVYTLYVKDIAKDTDLKNEISARKAIEGQNEDTYKANAPTNYISGANSLNDADVKLDTAIKEKSAESKTEFKIEENSKFLTLNANAQTPDKHTVYTLSTKDIASANDLANETSHRKNNTGFEKDYVKNTSSNYISDASNLNDADVKLDNAIKIESAKAKTEFEIEKNSKFLELSSNNKTSDSNTIYTLSTKDIASANDLANEISYRKNNTGFEGNYIANNNTNYLKLSDSLKKADEDLDAQIKVNTDVISEHNNRITTAENNIENLQGEVTRNKVGSEDNSISIKNTKEYTDIKVNIDGSTISRNAENGQLSVNLSGNEPILSVEKDGLLSNIRLNLISRTTENPKEMLQLLGKGGKTVSEIDVTDLVTDGMLQNVEVKGEKIVFTFNADGKDKIIEIPITDIVPTYQGISGVKVDGTNISGVVDIKGNEFLSVGPEGFKVSGVTTAFTNADATNLQLAKDYTDLLGNRVQTIENTLPEKIEANKEAISKINGDTDDTSVNVKVSNAVKLLKGEATADYDTLFKLESKIKENANSIVTLEKGQVTANKEAIAKINTTLGDGSDNGLISTVTKNTKRIETVEGKVSTLEEKVDVAKVSTAIKDSVDNLANGQVNTNKNAITDLTSKVDKLNGKKEEPGSVAYAANDALEKANLYTDGKFSDLSNGAIKSNSDAIAKINGNDDDTSVNKKITNALNPINESIAKINGSKEVDGSIKDIIFKSAIGNIETTITPDQALNQTLIHRIESPSGIPYFYASNDTKEMMHEGQSLNTVINNIKSSGSGTESEVNSLKEEINTLKETINTLKEKLNELEPIVNTLKAKAIVDVKGNEFEIEATKVDTIDHIGQECSIKFATDARFIAE